MAKKNVFLTSPYRNNADAAIGARIKKSGSPKKSMKLGGGGRFAAFVSKLKGKGKSTASAKAIAAVAGRKKYGKPKFQKLAKKGK